jgi:hypothetical protein
MTSDGDLQEAAMIELPDCSITEAHARGLRRAEDRWVEARQDRWNPLEQPRRFGPRVRAMHEDLLKVYGEGRVLQQRIGKKSVGWFCVEHDSAGRYTLTIRTLDRRPGLSRRGHGRLPLEASAHAYERFIQAMGRMPCDWVSTLWAVLRHLDEALGYQLDTDLDGDEPFRWQRHGFAKVWFAGGLALVKVPEVGNAVLVTIIETSALIGPNRVLWYALRTSKLKVLCLGRATS